MNRKRITVSFSILLIVYIVFRVLGYFLIPLINGILSSSDYEQMSFTLSLLGTIQLFFNYGFNLAVGIFLISEVKKYGHSKLLWFSLGSVFGLLSVILFYVYRIFEMHTKDINGNSNKELLD